MADGCRKGLELLHAPMHELPPIMGVIPHLDPMMFLAEVNGTRLADGDVVRMGTRVDLTHKYTSALGHQVAFLVSSGTLGAEGESEACGGGGARILCSTCGTDGGAFLRHTSWHASTPGNMTLTIGSAKMGLGTPAVTFAGVRVMVEKAPPGGGGGTAAAVVKSTGSACALSAS